MKLPIGVVLSILVILLPFSRADGSIAVDPGTYPPNSALSLSLSLFLKFDVFYGRIL